MRNIVVRLFGLVAIFALPSNSYTPQLPCPVMVNCADVKEIVWATAGNKCFVFQNLCHLTNENCQRQNRYEEVLTEVTEDSCRELCTGYCTRELKPVCAVFSDRSETFPNPCLLQYQSCLRGEPFMVSIPGECQSN